MSDRTSSPNFGLKSLIGGTTLISGVGTNGKNCKTILLFYFIIVLMLHAFKLLRIGKII